MLLPTKMRKPCPVYLLLQKIRRFRNSQVMIKSTRKQMSLIYSILSPSVNCLSHEVLVSCGLITALSKKALLFHSKGSKIVNATAKLYMLAFLYNQLILLYAPDYDCKWHGRVQSTFFFPRHVVHISWNLELWFKSCEVIKDIHFATAVLLVVFSKRQAS